MRICLIAESYAPALGGVEFALQKLVQGFLSRGHEVRVIAASWEGHASGIEAHGKLTIVRIRTFPFFRRFWFILFSIPSAIRGAAWADVVQGSTFAGGVPSFLGAWLTGRKKLLLVHEVLGKRWFRFEPNPISALFYYLTERIIVHLPFDHYETPSRFTKESLQSIGLSGSRVSVIYHGDSRFEETAISPKEVRKELGFKEDDFVFLAFGRAGVTKGLEYFVDAIADISRQIPAARFELILSHYDSRLSRRIKEVIAQLPPHVCKLVPPLSRDVLAAHVQASDCIVIPSLSEGFGFSALEACNAGKIVVSTNAGSLPEVVFGKHVFVESGSSRAIVEGCLKAHRGEVESVPVKSFTWEKSADEYRTGIRDTLGDGEMNMQKTVPGIQKSPVEKIFDEIYRKKSWGGADSVSGAGSDYDQTEVVRAVLPGIVEELQCKSLLDVPCGDFFWMNLVELDVDYVGGDIVAGLIRSNQRKYGSPRRSFLHINVIRDRLPKADLVVCRDCLVHFSDANVFSAVENIKSSGSDFLITTTFPQRERNEDITTGSWRAINLQLPPFNFPVPLKLVNEQCPTEGYADKCLGLWRIQEIPTMV